jgi:inner membrane protein
MGAAVKALVIGGIVLLLLAPLMMLRGLVSERTSLREHAYARVADGWGGSAIVGGPLLIVPTERMAKEGDAERLVRCNLYLLPASLDVKAELALEREPRRVGIYEVPVYLSHITARGRFDLRQLQSQLERPGVKYLWEQSRLRLPLSQVRSLREVRRAAFADAPLRFGPAAPGLYRGVDAEVDLSSLAPAGAAEFDFDLAIAGSRELSVLPLGGATSMTLASNWPHPSFRGAFLPVEHSITNEGFNARWQVLELNRAYAQTWWENEVDEAALLESAFGVGLYQPIDVYQRGERAIKYAALFIALTFLTFFAWEQVAGLRIHPLQYVLVGLALSTFYLLLIALSEHIAFTLAYSVAAAALASLIGVYISGALRSRPRGYGVGAAMCGVYALLYALVLSEDYALLLGALVLFAALAAVMLITRRVDWYGRSAAEPRSEAPGESRAWG